MQTIYLVGPTAVGKTAVALELAGRLNAEIVSADSMQVYRGMDIGTAKPTADELRCVRHHLVDVCTVAEVFDAQRFVTLATAAIAEIQARGRTALVVGGTGLYVRALRQGLFAGPGRDPALRQRPESMDVAALASELAQCDPVSFAQIDRQNPRRLVRALEVFHTTGQSIRQLQQEWNAPVAEPIIGLERDRPELVARIEQRIEQQMAAGWLAEVQRLREQGIEQNPTAMQAAGYRELLAHLRGELALSAAIDLIKTRTRQLAKRQMTWFRREAGLLWLALKKHETAATTAARIAEEI